MDCVFLLLLLRWWFVVAALFVCLVLFFSFRVGGGVDRGGGVGFVVSAPWLLLFLEIMQSALLGRVRFSGSGATG